MEIVKKMHPLGISVEVEEGEIGFASALKDFEHVEKYYTKVEDALALVEATRPEALAIFVGNGHGNYVDDPRIGLERIQEIVRAVEPYNVAVVLHGGSGLKPEFFRKVVAAGAAKFNYATSVSDILFEYFPQDLKDKMTQLAAEKGTEFRKTLKYVENDIDALDPVILEQARQAMTDHIRFMMREAFGSQGKSVLYS
jgi:fructose/tagatose bisphosphate aldolase